MRGCNHLAIWLFGGEPLLNFESNYLFLDEIQDYCNKNEIEFSTYIVTNGTLLKPSYLEKLKQYNCRYIQITLDGIKEIHDQRRIIIPKLVINTMSENNVIGIVYILIFTFLFNLTDAIFEYKLIPYISLQNEIINAKVVNSFLEKSYSLKISYFDDAKNYDKYNIVFDNCCNIYHKTKNILLQFLSSILQIALIISILKWVNKWVFCLMFIVIVISLITAQKTTKIQYEYQKKVTTQNRQLNYIYRLFYIPQFIRDMRINSLKEFIFNKKNKYTEDFMQNVKKNSKTASKVTILQSLITNVESLGIMGYFVYEFFKGKIWLDDFFIAINSYNKLKNAIEGIFSTYTSLYENDLYIKDYLEFMESNETEDKSGKYILNSQINSIEFDSVYFKYPNSKNYILKNVNFKIGKGEKIAILGSNGAGKTTIVKLIIRLYEIDKGRILINNIDIKDIDLVSLRESVSILFQDYSIYPFTILENVALKENADLSFVCKGLQKVKMLDKIKKMPLFLDTPITCQLSDNGIELSGGENQRIAIARILIRNRNVMVLDEPTSNLDPIIENELYETLINNSADDILIIISHRLTFMQKMDKIICLSDGSIKEMGTHEYLISQNGFYKKMYDINSSKYK